MLNRDLDRERVVAEAKLWGENWREKGDKVLKEVLMAVMYSYNNNNNNNNNNNASHHFFLLPSFLHFNHHHRVKRNFENLSFAWP